MQNTVLVLLTVQTLPVLVMLLTLTIYVFFTHANGLVNKMNELKIAVEMYNAQIICISETHLNQGINDCEVKLDNFQIYRQERTTGRKGGGSCVFVHKAINAEFIHDLHAPDSVGINF